MKNLHKAFVNKDYDKFIEEFFNMSNEPYYDIDDKYKAFLRDIKEQFNYDGSKKDASVNDLDLT